MIRTYTDLLKRRSFLDRFNYLKVPGHVGEDLFGYDRYLNQQFYRSAEWKRIRDQVIIRDNGCDLGVEGHTIFRRLLIHHMNPVTIDDVVSRSRYLLDPEFLICVDETTHNALHFSDETLLPSPPIDRRPNDTCPWRQ